MQRLAAKRAPLVAKFRNCLKTRLLSKIDVTYNLDIIRRMDGNLLLIKALIRNIVAILNGGFTEIL